MKIRWTKYTYHISRSDTRYMKKGEKCLCSGYRLLPGGEDCDGCKDCKRTFNRNLVVMYFTIALIVLLYFVYLIIK